ncbi:GntR family transcriptional regulator [Aquimarina sp. RZ0]|uniref:GntR family transcriptional regulator n=1 Tax=Aquimarina sp. RZ0 TaxID=2607730 RepID=UPI0011F28480|nr:GntR family transcriptional regulator [Aquimarina sp. RZ0]KAA1245806.1 GntR family transcriptional regulator [Aquimarina sp. RZ0]
MNSLFDKINKLNEVVSLSKQEKIIQGILDAITDKILEVGSKLPSVIQMARQIGCANKTVADAYNELKKRGIIESKSTKGYYVISSEINVKLKVALIIYAFNSFQVEFYNTFRKHLGEKYQIDIFFHHNNLSLFQTIINNISGKYGFYVIAPIQNEKVLEIINHIPFELVLLVNRLLKASKEYSYVAQEFEYTTYLKLCDLLPAILKFDQIILFFTQELDYPIGVLKAFKSFVKDYNIKSKVLGSYSKKDLLKNTVYFFVGDAYYWELLRDIKHSDYIIGQDIGILTHNDSIAKEILYNGITAISTDFIEMGKKAADVIKFKKRNVYEIIPSKIIRRGSL